MPPLTRITLATLLLAAAASRAEAGIADSPLPVLAGVKAKHVFSVPGVMNIGAFQTVFVCTSAEKDKTIRIAVEVFDDEGGAPENDVTDGEGAIDVEPGDTVVLATGETGAFTEDEIVDLDGKVISGGSARIVATSTKILCTAILTDGNNAPPSSMVQLTIVAKTRQKAAN